MRLQCGNGSDRHCGRAFGGLFVGRGLPGIAKGYNAIFIQMTTKVQNGTIRYVRPATAAKMFLGLAENEGQYPGAIASATVGYGVGQIAGLPTPCECK